VTKLRVVLLVVALGCFVFALWPRWENASTGKDDTRYTLSLGLPPSAPLANFAYHDTKTEEKYPNGGFSMKMDSGTNFNVTFTSWGALAIVVASLALSLRKYLGKKTEAPIAA
jgi:hypothetical protein